MDIKQQNILIDESLNIKITDFSVSQSYENSKNGSKFCLPLAGTSLYMSPEVLSKMEIDVEDCNKIDMFSLGTLLYNLAFGQFPYNLEFSDRKNFKGILEKITQKNLSFPVTKSYSSLFKKFLKGLLNKNLKERFSINEAMEDPWIRGAKLIFKEKEKMYDLEKFLINIVKENMIIKELFIITILKSLLFIVKIANKMIIVNIIQEIMIIKVIKIMTIIYRLLIIKIIILKEIIIIMITWIIMIRRIKKINFTIY